MNIVQVPGQHGVCQQAPVRCNTCPVRHKGLCATLSDPELHALHDVSRHVSFAAGETIAHECAAAIECGRVVSGLCKLVRTLHDGRQQLVGLLFPADLVGQPRTDGATPRSRFAVIAAADTTICQFSPGGLERAVSEHPKLETRLLQHALGDLETAREWLVVVGRKTAAERVATFFHHFICRSLAEGASFEEGIELALSRGDLADFLGLTLETVSRHIAAFKRMGVLQLSGTRRIVAADLDALATLAAIERADRLD